jgi:anti-sigma-K factor RskA
MTDPDHSYDEHEVKLLASLRELQSDDWQLDSPPAHVWAGIERAIRELPLIDDAPEPESPLPASGRLAPSRVTSSRRRWLVAASIVAVLSVGVGTVALLQVGNSSEVVVTATQLTSDGLDGAPEGLYGEASVIETGRGQVIQVDIGDLRPASGEFLEVWLIRPDVSGMVSLGTARPDGRYELPPGLRLADFPVVDVSTEPYDGDPVHSGASLLRGVLPS